MAKITKGTLVIFLEDFFNLRFQNPEVIPGYPLVPNLEDGPILQLDENLFTVFNHLIENIEKRATGKRFRFKRNYRFVP